MDIIDKAKLGLAFGRFDLKHGNLTLWECVQEPVTPDVQINFVRAEATEWEWDTEADGSEWQPLPSGDERSFWPRVTVSFLDGRRN